MEEFRPAPGAGAREQDSLRADLTSIPDGVGFMGMLIFALGISAGFALDPASAPSNAALGSIDGQVIILLWLPVSGQTSLVAIEIAGAVGFTALAIASFVLPLRGMHGRLASEKDRLIAHANSRLRTVQARLHQSVDSDDLSRADELQKTQAALLAERELYARLSTWPWSQGSFRGFASAVILPIALGVVLRILGRFV